jgi:hypothetical protein
MQIMKKLGFIWLGLVLVLSACQAITPTNEDTPTMEVISTQSEITVEPTMVVATTKESEPVPTEDPTTLPTVTMEMNTATIVVEKTPEEPISSEFILIDHRAVALFESIPPEYLEKARNTKLIFSDRSVGANISQGLDCLALGTSWGSVPANCRRGYVDKSGTTWTWKTFTSADLANQQVPSDILYDPDPVIYDRSNWTFDIRMGEWDQLIADFVNQIVPQNLEKNEIFSFQFNYFSVAAGSDITDPETGFFIDQPHDGYYPNRERWDISDLEDLEVQYPDKRFFYWTTSLARSVGSEESQIFNDQMRDYAAANGKVLYDFADIISHDPDNNQPCFDNRDGVEYCSQNGDCENHPDDGVEIPAICQDYTTEIDGGHLGSVASGKIRAAKAFWVMVAVMNGWDGLDQLN